MILAGPKRERIALHYYKCNTVKWTTLLRIDRSWLKGLSQLFFKVPGRPLEISGVARARNFLSFVGALLPSEGESFGLFFLVYSRFLRFDVDVWPEFKILKLSLFEALKKCDSSLFSGSKMRTRQKNLQNNCRGKGIEKLWGQTKIQFENQR